jgi:hypothetical protein
MPQKKKVINPNTGKYCSGTKHCQFWQMYQEIAELWHLQEKTPRANYMRYDETNSTETLNHTPAASFEGQHS